MARIEGNERGEAEGSVAGEAAESLSVAAFFLHLEDVLALIRSV